jgi:hypothetical protein
MAQRELYTDQVLSRFIAILGESGTVNEACGRLGSEMSKVIDPNNIRSAMRRKGMRAPTDYLRAPEPEHVDPVQRQERQTRAKVLKREHAALLAEVQEARERDRVLLALDTPDRVSSLPRREKRRGSREACAVILASDWHIEETVDADKVAGRNAYDLGVARQRAGRFFAGAEWLLGMQRQAFTIRDVVLWLGGDLISGFIHEELQEGNSLSPTEAILELRDWLTDGIDRMLRDDQTRRLVIPCSYGNHGRTGPRKKVSRGAENSYEWLLYRILEKQYAGDKRVSFQVARGEHTYVDVYGQVLHFHHGDSVNYGGGVGGITIPLNKAISGWNTVKPADVHNIGHFHQLTWTRNAVVNGSLMGFSPYAFHVKAHFEAPQQAFYVLDAKRGRSICAPIWVADTTEEKAT